MMKKREKPPEVEAFERAFDASGQRATSSFSRSQMQPSSSAARALGRTSGSNPALRASASLAAASWSPAPGQPPGRGTGPKPPQRLGVNDGGYEEDEDEEWQPWAASRKRPALPPPRRDGFSSALARVALMLVALIAAYSLQSHSRHHYIPGTIKDATVSNISYDAGWPLAYAHVNAQQAPLSDVDPTPAFHYINPTFLAVDVLALAVPFWLLLEAAWLFWVFILERFGPRRLLRRLVAVGLTALPATLWMLGGLAAGVFLGFSGGAISALPKYLLPLLVPAAPGFGLAAGVSLVLGVPPALWRLDFGVFLLTLAVPLALLTICLYTLFCLIGRGMRSLVLRQTE
jgi:hypothetical protein